MVYNGETMALKLFNWGTTDPLFDQRPSYKLPKQGPILDHEGNPLSKDYTGYKVVRVNDEQGQEQQVLIASRNGLQTILVFKKGRFEEVEIPDAIGETVHELKFVLEMLKKNIGLAKDAIAELSQKPKSADVEAEIKAHSDAKEKYEKNFKTVEDLIAKAEKLRAEGVPMPNIVESFSIERRRVGKRFKNVVVGKIGKREEVLTDDLSKVSAGANLR